MAEFQSRCLDPSCGHGQFLVEALRRKLAAAIAIHHIRTPGTCDSRSRKDGAFEYDALTALSSLYGVDIDFQNAEDARNRLLAILDQAHYFALGNRGSRKFRNAASAILQENVICADFLQFRYYFVEYIRSGDGRFARARWRAKDVAGPDDLRLIPAQPVATYPAIHWTELAEYE